MTSDIARRYGRVAGRFTATVDAVDDGAWNDPAPCDGWVAAFRSREPRSR